MRKKRTQTVQDESEFAYQEESQSKLDSSVATPINGFVIYTLVNVRAEPNLSSRVIDYVKKGQKVDIVEVLDEWYKIKHQHSFGYIFKRCIEEA